MILEVKIHRQLTEHAADTELIVTSNQQGIFNQLN